MVLESVLTDLYIIFINASYEMKFLKLQFSQVLNLKAIFLVMNCGTK